MSSTDIEFFLNLESSVWKALVCGDPTADASLLAENFLGVYSTGFAGRDEHVGQLAVGPIARAYSLSNARVIHLCPDTVVLSYLATWSRHGSGSDAGQERTYISSIWQHQNGVWRNVFSQDTKADA
ncbi:MAG: nuclear transport factor 2 family protein [Betaproteobacteria bacterium]|nr:nuclear transport factor 2 family protein [Betaproteobacteria bacterium]